MTRMDSIVQNAAAIFLRLRQIGLRGDIRKAVSITVRINACENHANKEE